MSCLFAVLFNLCRAAGSSDFETANELYDASRFAEAKVRYERGVEARDWSANLFYNLGNCDYRLGKPGRAILDYERALMLDPAHPEARANLTLLRGLTGAKLPARAWPDAFFSGLTLDVWTLIAAASGWLAVFLLSAIFTARGASRPRSWFSAIFSAVVCGIAVTALWRGATERMVAVITAPTTEARLAPTENAGLAETLPAGSRVRILGERGEWSYGVLPDERRGWISRGALECVRLPKS